MEIPLLKMVDMQDLLKQIENVLGQAFNNINIEKSLQSQLDLLQSSLLQTSDKKERKIIENQIILVRRSLSGKLVYLDKKKLKDKEKSQLEKEYINLKREYDEIREELDFIDTYLTRLKDFYIYALENKINKTQGFFWISEEKDKESNKDILIKLARVTFRSKQVFQLFIKFFGEKLKLGHNEFRELINQCTIFLDELTNLESFQKIPLSLVHQIKAGHNLSNQELIILENINTRNKICDFTENLFKRIKIFSEQDILPYKERLSNLIKEKKNEIEIVIKTLKEGSEKRDSKLVNKLNELVYGKRTNILLLGIQFELKCGVVSVMKDILKNIDRKRFNVFVITHWFNDYSYHDRFLNERIDVHAAPYNLLDIDGKKISMNYNFGKILIQLKEEFHFIPDVIHLHTHTYEMDKTLDPILNTLGNPPMAYTLHQLIPFKPLSKHIQDQLLGGALDLLQIEKIKDQYYNPRYEGNKNKEGQLKSIYKSDQIITISETHRRAFQIMFPEYSDKVISIPNGTDIRRYINKNIEPMAEQLRKRIAPNGEKIILHVGRLEKQKRPDLLFQGFNMIASKYPNVKILMIGPKKKGFIEEAVKYGLDQRFINNIMIVEWVSHEELPSYYMAGDILIYPLLERELYSIVVLESLLMGTPVITCESRYSFFGNTDTPQNIATAFEYFIQNEERVKSKIKEFQSEVEDNYSIKKFIKEHEDVYASLAKHRKPKVKALTPLEYQFEVPQVVIPVNLLSKVHPWNKDIVLSFDGSLIEAKKIIEKLDELGIENYRFYIMGSKLFKKKSLEKMGCEFSREKETADVPIKLKNPVEGAWWNWFEKNRGNQNINNFITSLMKGQSFSSAKWIIENFKNKYGNQYIEKLSEHFAFHTVILHPPSQHTQHISNFYSDKAILNELNMFQYLMRLVLGVNKYKVKYGRTPGGGGFIYGDDPITHAKSKRLQLLAQQINPSFLWRVWRTEFDSKTQEDDDPRHIHRVALKALKTKDKPVYNAWWDINPCEILMHTYKFIKSPHLKLLEELVKLLDQYSQLKPEEIVRLLERFTKKKK
jgi:glycosyltransferase involved in cell wall biosynthesis